MPMCQQKGLCVDRLNIRGGGSHPPPLATALNKTKIYWPFPLLCTVHGKSILLLMFCPPVRVNLVTVHKYLSNLKHKGLHMLLGSWWILEKVCLAFPVVSIFELGKTQLLFWYQLKDVCMYLRFVVISIFIMYFIAQQAVIRWKSIIFFFAEFRMESLLSDGLQKQILEIKLIVFSPFVPKKTIPSWLICPFKATIIYSMAILA